MYLCIHMHKWKYKHACIIYICDLHHACVYIHLSLFHPHQHHPRPHTPHTYTHYIDSLSSCELFFFLWSCFPVLTEPWGCFALISVCVPIANLPLFCQTCALSYHENAARKHFILESANLVLNWVLSFIGSVNLGKSSELLEPLLAQTLTWCDNTYCMGFCIHVYVQDTAEKHLKLKSNSCCNHHYNHNHNWEMTLTFSIYIINNNYFYQEDSRA